MEYPFQGLGPTLHILALAIVLIMSLAVVAIAVILAILPGYLAAKNHHPQTSAIRVLGFVGLPTGFLWCIVMASALWKSPSGANIQPSDGASTGLDSRLKRIETLLSKLESQPN